MAPELRIGQLYYPLPRLARPQNHLQADPPPRPYVLTHPFAPVRNYDCWPGPSIPHLSLPYVPVR
eukprot:1055807-Rhodomonas_salina.2